MAAQSAAAGMPAAGTAAVPVLQNNRSAGELLKDFALRHRKPLLVSLAAVLTAGYISTAVYYHDKFYPGTKFFGIPAAGMTVEEVKTAVTAKVNSYSLSILERNGGTPTGIPRRRRRWKRTRAPRISCGSSPGRAGTWISTSSPR